LQQFLNILLMWKLTPESFVSGGLEHELQKRSAAPVGLTKTSRVSRHSSFFPSCLLTYTPCPSPQPQKHAKAT